MHQDHRRTIFCWPVVGAEKASVPIQLYGIDFPGKRIVCTKRIVPCGNLEKDMREISDYYRQFKDTGLKPEKFALDEGD